MRTLDRSKARMIDKLKPLVAPGETSLYIYVITYLFDARCHNWVEFVRSRTQAALAGGERSH